MNKFLVSAALLVAFASLACGAPKSAPVSRTSSATGSPAAEPTMDWGKCPQLAPTEAQRKQKAEVIKKCHEQIPLKGAPVTLHPEVIEKHRIKIGECAWGKDDWFNADKTYKYEKAEAELKAKDIEASLKTKILNQHTSCKQQAMEKFASVAKIIEQIQFYQSCMDFHVSKLCNIKAVQPTQ